MKIIDNIIFMMRELLGPTKLIIISSGNVYKKIEASKDTLINENNSMVYKGIEVKYHDHFDFVVISDISFKNIKRKYLPIITNDLKGWLDD